MKHTAFFALALGLLCSSQIKAQKVEYHKVTSEEKATSRTNIMACELALTAAEIPKVQVENLKAAISMDSVFEKITDYSGRVRIMKKLDKKRDIAMRHTMSADHYSMYLSLIDGDPQALKDTRGCREGKDTW